MRELWAERCQILRKMQSHPENATMSDEELWEHKAPLHPEFGRVVCISLGKLVLEPNPLEPKIQLNSVYGENEKEILAKFSAGIEKASIKNTHTTLVGHNIKRFDIPFLGNRMLINDIGLPGALTMWNKKPWDMKFIDSSEVWSFGAWQQGFSSVKVLATVLGLPSPKEEMSGKDVYAEYYHKKNYEGIRKYCEEGDVLTQGKIMLRLAGYSADVVNSLQILPKKEKKSE
jgi:predicted PolB exonuclease-like 3'-5' exonuclease